MSSRIQFLDTLILNEESYVEHLHHLDVHLIQPLVLSRSPAIRSMTSHPQVSIYFRTLNQLLTIHKEFLTELNTKRAAWKELKDDQQRIGGLFVRYGRIMKCYGILSKNSDIAREEVMFSTDSAVKMEISRISKEHYQGHTLDAALTKPLFRITQYLQNVSSLLQSTRKSHPDYEDLLKAQAELHETSEAILEAAEDRRKVALVYNIECEFNGSPKIFDLRRRFMKSGELDKVCRKNEKTYTFHLFSDILTYSARSMGRYTLHRKLYLRDCECRALRKKFKGRFAIELRSPQRSFIALASDEAERDEWVEQISAVIAEERLAHYGTDGYKGVLAPVWVRDQDETECFLCDASFTIFNRRHHCRFCGLLVCGSCSRNRRVLSHISGNDKHRVCDSCVVKVDENDYTQANPPSGLFSVSYTDDFPRSPTISSMSTTPVPEISPGSLSARGNVINELLLKEQGYVKDLGVLYSVFAQPLLEMSYLFNKRKGHVRSGSGIVQFSHSSSKRSSIDMKDIPISLLTGRFAEFLSQIETLYTINTEFLKALQKRVQSLSVYSGREGQDDCEVGDIFMEYGGLFKVYGEYARGHTIALHTLHMKEFHRYVDHCESHDNMNGQSLGSSLIKPIQQVPRYLLLLRELKKHTDKSHADYEQILEAIETVSVSAAHMNDAMKHDENVSMIRNIEDKFGGPSVLKLLVPTRKFIKEGVLLKKQRTGKWEEYVFHLFSDILVYSTASGVGKAYLKHHRSLLLKYLKIEDAVDAELQQKHVIRLNSMEKSFLVACGTAVEKKHWIAVISKAKAALNDFNKSFGKQRAPVWKPDDQHTSCVICLTQFSWLFRRHHCRKCGEVVCGDCSSKFMLLPNIDKTTPQRVCRYCYSETNPSSRLSISISKAEVGTNSVVMSELKNKLRQNGSRGLKPRISEVVRVTRERVQNTRGSCEVCLNDLVLKSQKHDCVSWYVFTVAFLMLSGRVVCFLCYTQRRKVPDKSELQLVCSSCAEILPFK